MAKTAIIRSTITATDQATPPTIGSTPSWTGVMDYHVSLADGTGANQFDIVYMAERTVASATNDDIDLAGVLASVFGATITAAEIVAIQIINKPVGSAVNTTNLTIGANGAAINPWIGLIDADGSIGPLRPGAAFMASSLDASGLGAVTADTGDILRVANSAGASATYQIAILARSA